MWFDVPVLSFSQPILCVPLDVKDTIGIPSFPFVPTVNIANILNCDSFVGYLAVYRVCMAVASFFFFLFLVMMCVWTSKDPRSYLQNGFWCIKWLVVIGLVIAFFFIPDGQNFYFSRGICKSNSTCFNCVEYVSSHSVASLGLGLAASVVFIVIQIILLVDFAHSWADAW